MIKKYIIGEPLETGATVRKIKEEASINMGLLVDYENKTLTRKMSDDAVIYGLGETVRGINKRGFKYRSFCSDDPEHNEGKESLYGAHNFFIVDEGGKSIGYFIDNPGSVWFDFGFAESDVITVTLDYFDAYVYVIDGASNKEIVREFRSLIGKAYIPPKWAFGFGQSRWGYKNEADIRAVVKGYREAGMPIDMVYLDIDYMEDYKDFTISEERFPKFKEFVDEMKNEGIHLVPIIDAGVKIEEGYDIYGEGMKGGFFCKKEDGTELVSAVWPGRTHFPDFLNKEAREWFGSKYKVLIDNGIEGFWNDMNEPAIFYTEDHLKEVFEGLEQYKNKNIGIYDFFGLKDLVLQIANNPEDYRRFFHDMDGKRVNHERVHNLYGFNMTRAAGEAFEKLCPEKKILMFSRASYIGAHRYGGIWTGDNSSRWEHLLMNLCQMPGLNMCGFVFSGADTGGFGGNTSRDLLMRWFALSMFTPLFRNHSALGTRNQEAYAFGDTEDFKHLLELRYALIPYIYSEFMYAVENDEMYMSPLAFEFPSDKRAREIEDQLLVGRDIMIAPVYRQNATGRYVYLPEDMRLVRFRSPGDYDVCELKKGDHYIDVALNEVPVFIRKDRKLMLGKSAMSVGEIDFEDVKEI